MTPSNLSADVVDDLRSLRPSARLVYIVLENDGELTQGQLIERTLLSRSSVRRALEDLQAEEFVTERISPDDARCRLYRVDDHEQ